MTGQTTIQEITRRYAARATAGTTGWLKPGGANQGEREFRRLARACVAAYGDAVVPQITEAIGHAIRRVEHAMRAAA